MTDFVTVVLDNFALLVVLSATIVLVALVLGVLSRLHSNRHRTAMAELAMQQSKLQMIQRRELLRDLTSAAVVLNDGERARLDAINEDLATLSRRAVAMMTEVDARTARLERGVEIAKMGGQLDKIRKNETRLFALKGNSEGGGR